MADDTAAFFQPMDDDMDAFAAAPTDAPSGDYIGEIDAAPPAVFGEESDLPLPVESMPVVLAPPPPAEEEPDVMILPAPPAPSTAAVLVEDVVEEEPPLAAEIEASPMTIWNNEWQVTLKARKDEENALKGSHVEAAEKDLAAFSAQRDAKREARISKNRADEQDKLEAIEADLENDNSWQRVVKMVELNQDAQEDAKDCSRMKDVLILLKNDEDRAAILA